MTTFETLEESTEDSRPLELYTFTVGDTTYRYTSAEDDITIGSLTWEAITIERGTLEQSQDAPNRTFSITVAASNAIAQRFIGSVPGQKAVLDVYRYQRDESPAFNTSILLFTGRIQQIIFSEDASTATIQVASLESAGNETVPRMTFAGMCNHILYDAGCKVVASAFQYVGAVTAVSGSTITVLGASTSSSGFDFTGGYARPAATGDDFRLVISQSGDVLTLLLPFAASVLGTDVQVFAGCDHIVTGDCANTFNNVANFGGFGFVPNRNPFTTELI